jgi:hypothetical protein
VVDEARPEVAFDVMPSVELYLYDAFVKRSIMSEAEKDAEVSSLKNPYRGSE